MYECPKCDGKGYVPCTSCGGTGWYFYVEGGKCDGCDDGEVECGVCRGTGRVEWDVGQ